MLLSLRTAGLLSFCLALLAGCASTAPVADKDSALEAARSAPVAKSAPLGPADSDAIAADARITPIDAQSARIEAARSFRPTGYRRFELYYRHISAGLLKAAIAEARRRDVDAFSIRIGDIETAAAPVDANGPLTVMWQSAWIGFGDHPAKAGERLSLEEAEHRVSRTYGL